MNPAIVSPALASAATAQGMLPSADTVGAGTLPRAEPDPTPANAGSLGNPSPQAARGLGAGRLIAELPALRGSSLVRSWNRGVIRQMQQRNPARLTVPAIRTPPGSAGGNILRAVLPRGAVYVPTGAAGIHPLQSFTAAPERLASIESAFTPQRIAAFGRLDNEQKMLARSLLAPLVGSLEQGPGGTAPLTETEFSAGVGAALQAAQSYRAPGAQAVSTTPAADGVPNVPAGRPVVGETPAGQPASDLARAVDVPLARTPARDTTARIGEPSAFPVNARRPGTRIDTLIIGNEIFKAVVVNRVNTAADNLIAKPVQRLGARAFNAFAATPGGRVAVTVLDAAGTKVKAQTAEGTPIGNTLAFLDRNVVRNEGLWNTLGVAGDVGRKLGLAGAAGTMASLTVAYNNGTLESGTFNSGGKLTPDQAEMVRAVNIPPGMDVVYFRAPGSITVNVNGKNHPIKTRAFVVIAGGRNTLLLPATGPGKPGAQPWIGYDAQQQKMVVASSSVGAGGWGLIGGSNGTTNFNTSWRADVQGLRGLWNALAFNTGPGPTGGRTTTSLQSILIFDKASTFFTSTTNMGPFGFVGERLRNPQTERVFAPGGLVNVAQHDSRVRPAVPLTGSATFDPKADDWKLLGEFFSPPSPPTQPGAPKR